MNRISVVMFALLLAVSGAQAANAQQGTSWNASEHSSSYLEWLVNWLFGNTEGTPEDEMTVQQRTESAEIQDESRSFTSIIR
jgi:hypothetical protein